VKCVTCSDEVVPIRVTALPDGARAVVDVGGSTEEVSVSLIDAAVGDFILVHAGVAIAKVHAPG
jgi:hydrogenase expression/formation protein HypC